MLPFRRQRLSNATAQSVMALCNSKKKMNTSSKKAFEPRKSRVLKFQRPMATRQTDQRKVSQDGTKPKMFKDSEGKCA
jgi:hypothetical protein